MVHLRMITYLTTVRTLTH